MNEFFSLSSSILISDHVENNYSEILMITKSIIKFHWDEPLFSEGLSNIWGLRWSFEIWPFDIDLVPRINEEEEKSPNLEYQRRDLEFGINSIIFKIGAYLRSTPIIKNSQCQETSYLLLDYQQVPDEDIHCELIPLAWAQK